MRVAFGMGMLCLTFPVSAQTSSMDGRATSPVIEAQPTQQPSIVPSGRPAGTPQG